MKLRFMNDRRNLDPAEELKKKEHEVEKLKAEQLVLDEKIKLAEKQKKLEEIEGKKKEGMW